jgi:hypothetical protein
VIGQPLGGLGANSGQPREGLDESRDGFDHGLGPADAPRARVARADGGRP